MRKSGCSLCSGIAQFQARLSIAPYAKKASTYSCYAMGSEYIRYYHVSWYHYWHILSQDESCRNLTPSYRTSDACVPLPALTKQPLRAFYPISPPAWSTILAKRHSMAISEKVIGRLPMRIVHFLHQMIVCCSS